MNPGNTLSVSVTLATHDAELDMLAAVVLATPRSDLTKTGDNYYINDGVDPMLPGYDHGLGRMGELYANGHDLKGPRLSPVYAEYAKGVPTTVLATGTRDLLLSCTVRLHRAMMERCVEAELHVFEAMGHGFNGVPESEELSRETVLFFEENFGS